MPIHAVASACSSTPPPGSGLLRSKRPMLSSPRNPPSKTLRPRAVLAVHPPGEVEHQLEEDALEERAVAAAEDAPLDLVDAVRRPRVHRRVHVAELPLVRRDLPVRVHVPLAHQQGRAAAWRTPGRRAPAGCSGTPGPTRRTRGTPTCRAWRGPRSCRGAASRALRPCRRDSGGGGLRRDRRAASARRRTRSTACTTAGPRAPARKTRFSSRDRLRGALAAKNSSASWMRLSKIASKSENGRICAPVGVAQAHGGALARQRGTARSARPPWCRAARGSPRRAGGGRWPRGRRPSRRARGWARARAWPRWTRSR